MRTQPDIAAFSNFAVNYREMSDILGVPLGTVKSKLFSARAALRQIWCNGRKE
jgi:hypothetical protein